MGRVCRIRRRKVRRLKAVQIGSLSEIISLRQWLVRNGWESPCLLDVALFSNTGRGVIARQSIAQSDLIAKVPLSLVISVSTVTKSRLSDLFKGSSWLPQQVIAAFLVWERHLGEISFWKDYLRVLPAKYNSPMFTGDELDLPSFQSSKLIRSRCNMTRSYSTLIDHCTAICNHCGLRYADIFTEEMFVWAWFTVNSRCVYIPPCDNTKHDISLSEPDNIVLVPFLDMFNHSNEASIKAEIKNNHYILSTNVMFRKYSQVFIHYGDHDNTKLFLEYGFIIPDNANDFISLEFDEIIQACHYIDPKLHLSERKLKYLESYNLLRDLKMTYNGFSWCFLNLISAIFIADERLSEFDFDADLSNSVVKNVSRCVVRKKSDEFNLCISKLKPLNTDSSSLAICLLQEMLNVLSVCDKMCNE